MALFVKKCPCLRPKIEEDIRLLDYRHCSLNDVPSEVFNFERTLEELLMDSNQIQDLPRELFYCHGIRKLSISDNEIKQIPAAIGQLISLETLDLSKNGVINLPDNIKTCKYLQIVDASVNPLGKLPEGFTQLLNLTQLYLNDTLLDYLPGNFGRLSKLKILEIRENHLKTLPKSFSRLVELEKLDIGHNEFMELPDVIGSLSSLLELWCDHNQIQSLTPTIGNLKQLMFFDGCKNCLQSLPSEIEGCISLADLHLTTNQIQILPDSIGNLGNLTTLKVDDNCLTALPATFGGLSSLSELNVSANCLQGLPASLGLLGYLRTLYADENQLEFIPAELGSCSGITVLSLRSNKLTYIPDEIGRIPRLRVLNLSANQLKYLPFTFVKLKELQALWLSENQTRPLIPLQSEHEPDNGRKILTCYLLPQRPPQETVDVGGDTDSFHASQWEDERHARQQIHFEFGNDSDMDGSLIRQPTPYPKEMREKARHLKNLTIKQQMNNNTSSSWPQGEDNAAYDKSPSTEKPTAALNQDNGGFDVRTRDSRLIKQGSPSLHDPYTLYKYDKEKFAKDKARMLQKHNAVVDNNDEKQQTPRKTASHENSPARSDCSSSKKGKDKRSRNSHDDGDCGFNEPRVSTLASTADLPSSANVRESSAHRKFTYCSPEEMSENLAVRSDVRDLRNSNHRSHRSHRMRDYDSDTGYRSDQEMMQLQHQQQQVYGRCSDNYSEIVPVHNLKGHRRDGYSSDLEGYSRRSSLGTALNNPSDLSNKNSQTHSIPYDINRTPSSSHQLSTQTNAVKNDELYEQTSFDINSNNCTLSSPTLLQRRNFMDLSTPVTPTEGRSSCIRPDKDYEFQRAVGPLDPENRYMPTNPEQSQVTTTSMKYDTYTVPPYKPAPPYPLSPAQRKLPPTPNRSSPYCASVSDRPTRGAPMKDYQQRMPDIQEVRDQKSDLSRSWSRDHDLQDLRNSDSESLRNYVQSGSSPNIPTLQSVNPTRISQIHNQVDVASASAKDLENSNYSERTTGDSPVSYRHSPLSGRMERHHSRISPFQYAQDPRHTFERYDSSFQKPTTIDIPVRYEDIAIFKSSEPPSQVSSSTDSGYGHNIFEKMMESQRFTGSPKGSASPDHFNSDSNCTSSSHMEVSGQYSRGATPTNNSESDIPVQPEQGTRYERGLFMTKVPPGDPAAAYLQCGDQLLEVNNADLIAIDHHKAVNVHRSTGDLVQLYVERDTTS